MIWIALVTAQLQLVAPDQTYLLHVSIPENYKEAAVGLSKCEKLDPDEGMFFIHEREDFHPFTMQETSIPLLFLFFDQNLALTEVQEGAPFQNRLIIPRKKCQYVLEVNPDKFKHLKTSLKNEVKINSFK